MKIAISYPPLDSPKGVPLLSQNRQFQWFNAPTYIYPVIPATAATLLQREGHAVVWDDAVAEGKSFADWEKSIIDSDIDVVAMESKTPVIKKHWRIIQHLKERKPSLTTVLMGDHPTALPHESMENCPVDYLVSGGDYDFSLLALCNHLADRSKPMPRGVYYRDGSKVADTGTFAQTGDLATLPWIDRDLTKWQLYAYKNGNYKYTPGTYTMAGRDCWWRKDGGCTFCSWTVIYPQFQKRTPEDLLNEVEMLVGKYGIREIFDDTGTFPCGSFLQEFCEGMIARGLNKRVHIGCNMKPGILKPKDYALMGRANFRFILFGVESGNDETLVRLNKGNSVQDIRDAMKWAKEGGLEPHVTCMVGYPWESLADAKKTIALTKDLFQRGYIDTLQATICIPYAGTRLWKQCVENGWLLTQDYDDFDMRKQVMKSECTTEHVRQFARELYWSFLSLPFIFNKLKKIRTLDDVTYLFRGAIQLIGHVLDFRKSQA